MAVAGGLLTHLRRGTLEFCVLALLRDGEMYAVDLTRTLSNDDILVSGEGTVYPLLSRLRKDRLVDTSWRESPTGGPPRRYYRLTALGQSALTDFEAQWGLFRNAVDDALKGNLR